MKYWFMAFWNAQGFQGGGVFKSKNAPFVFPSNLGLGGKIFIELCPEVSLEKIPSDQRDKILTCDELGVICDEMLLCKGVV